MKKFIVLMLTASLVAPAFGANFIGTQTDNHQMNSLVKTPEKKEIRTVVFSVAMHCHKCVEKINANIAYEKGVKSLDVSFDKLTVTIGYDVSKTNETKLADAIRKLGYQVKVVAPAQK